MKREACPYDIYLLNTPYFTSHHTPTSEETSEEHRIKQLRVWELSTVNCQLITMVTQSEQIESTFSKIIRLLRWNKPEGRLILMIPGLWAVFLA
ncbi:MAG: hypothetical protein ACFCUV_26925, partial [Rivularia sp. (in: cyanobacteria)]